MNKECGLQALSPGIGIRTAWLWIPAVAPDHLVALDWSVSQPLGLSVLICKMQGVKLTSWVFIKIK